MFCWPFICKFGQMGSRLVCLFLGEKSPNGNSASNLWLKFSFSSKRIRHTSTLFGEERVATSLSTDYSLNDPVQKRRQLMRTLTESVWGPLASVATLQK
jgi:hypothetical protein